MRLPAGKLDDVMNGCARKRYAVLGCLSFEDRCLGVPLRLAHSGYSREMVTLLKIEDPKGAFPDYSAETNRRMQINAGHLKTKNVGFEHQDCKLLGGEDEILDALMEWERKQESIEDVVLDISSLPKRYFCLMLKRLSGNARVRNLVVTYTEVGEPGYTQQPLCDDPMSVDYLPGFGAPLPPIGERLVVSVGFEALNMSSLVKVYRDTTREVKFLLSSPPGQEPSRRQWNTIRGMARIGAVRNPPVADTEVIGLWDTETVYLRLERWADELAARLQSQPQPQAQVPTSGDARRGILALAPFGPKPHSLAMALFAMKHRCGLYYTQPRSYNPDYSKGVGMSWAYVVKWAGVMCFDR